MTAPQLAGLPLPDKPYRGIDSFRLVDSPIFCAREREVQKLFRMITIYRGVLLYGTSGVGKSSLMNAGLLREAIEGGLSPERIRVQPRLEQEVIVERIPLTPNDQPPYVRSVFAPEGSREPRVVLSAGELPARLRKVEEGTYPLLIFDQFEEFITLFEEAPLAKDREEAAKAQDILLGVLTELLRDHSFPVKLLFSFREDYLAKLNNLFARYPALTDQYLRLVPPDKSALPVIIRGPFKDERLRNHFGRELSEEVAAELVREIEEHRPGGPVNLSEVEIASLRLWESPDPAALLKQRKVQGLLEDYLQDSLQRLGSLRDPAVALLSPMVTGRGTRNVILEEDLLIRVEKEEKLPEARLRLALEALEKKTGLVRRERRNDNYFYEIVSEFLVPWIRREKQDREQRVENRRFLLWVSAGTALVLLLLGGGLAWRTWTLSQADLVKAEKAKAAEADNKAAEAAKRAEETESALEQLQTRFRAQEQAWISKLTLAQAEQTRLADLREEDLKILRSQLTTQASQQQQELMSQYRAALGIADGVREKLEICETTVKIVEIERARLSTESQSCKSGWESSREAARKELGACEARIKDRCPGSYDLSEVNAVVDKLQSDHRELGKELDNLRRSVILRTLGMGSESRALNDAIEQQKEAAERVGTLRRLLGLDAQRPLERP